MKLVVGLGNPGRKYQGTRHNLGFEVVDELARRWQIDMGRERFSGMCGDGLIGEQRVLLLKPLTFMNRSGRAVREALTFHKLDVADLLVIVDDRALPLGRLRIRGRGSAGGHNGLADIVRHLGGEAFARLRIGIDWASGAATVGHVLGSFSAQEQPIVDEAIILAAEAVECWAQRGLDDAMNRYNRTEDANETRQKDGQKGPVDGGIEP